MVACRLCRKEYDDQKIQVNCECGVELQQCPECCADEECIEAQCCAKCFQQYHLCEECDKYSCEFTQLPKSKKIICMECIDAGRRFQVLLRRSEK
jgi:hypothetical protein